MLKDVKLHSNTPSLFPPFRYLPMAPSTPGRSKVDGQTGHLQGSALEKSPSSTLPFGEIPQCFASAVGETPPLRRIRKPAALI